ncbi:MAG: helix-turn-helix transcriptional regulator [Xanthobacteraceae bacterium]
MATPIGRRRRSHLYIAEWMEQRGLSDERLANRVGVARQTVYRWRVEQWRLDPDKIAVLASALDLQPEDLWRPPSRPSLDAMVKDVPEELRKTAADIVRRLVGKSS